MAEEKKFNIIGLGVHTIDYATVGNIPTLEEGVDLSITGPMMTHPGGIGNGMPVAAKLFPGRVGAVTLLGNDANGHAFLAAMKDAGVDTTEIKWNTDLPDRQYEILNAEGKPESVPRERLSTGMSFVCLDPETRDRIIFFSPGINQVIGSEHLNLDYLGRSKSVIISYATLLRALDKDRGGAMANLIRDLRGRDVLTVLDTHSIKGADYGVLEKPLKEVDVFGCNIGEARSITGLGEDAAPEMLLNSIAGKMGIDESRSRIIAISMKERGCAVAYYRPGEKDPVIAVEPACKVKVVDATGAGDTFKVGLVAYVVENLDAYKNGRLDIREAARFANATAASYIRDYGTAGVGTYEETMQFARKQYPQTMGLAAPADKTTTGRREPPKRV
ncbi:MAG: carbohydrate kinase family protein [Candidatus Altiarchaeales archaeon]|nr:carbohydrate kinase family protein [Candidatus Altiarchaeales archaeon]